MKKSVIILIGVIYFAAIAMVSFFGLMPEVYVTEQKVESITIIGDDIVINSSTNQKSVKVFADENGVWEYQLQYVLNPDDATNAKVDFVYDDHPSVTVSDTGLVTYVDHPDGFPSVKIKILATDGSGASDVVTLYFL